MAEPETLLQLGIEAAREGNREEARNLFSLLTRQEPDNVQAWLWLAGVAEGPEQRRAALERVIALDPNNEMAIKGLQAMGAPLPKRESERPTEAPPSPPPASEAQAKPASPMTDEEKFAAELDSAFDDYDALPRATPPPRADTPPEDAGKLPPMPPRSSPTPPRSSPTPPRSSPARARDEDEEEEPARRGPSPLLWILLGVIALVLIVFLIIQLFFPPGGGPAPTPPTQVVEQPTTAPGAGGEAATPEGGAVPPVAEVTPQPSEATPETTPGVEPTVAPPTEQPTPEPAPVTPPEQAQPAPAAIGTILQADGWNYTYPNQLYALSLGPKVGNFTAEQGTFLHVLVFVANNTGTNQPLPRDFFVLKDAQGRVYQARPEVSSAAVRPGVNADVGHETPIPANGLTTSVYLVFDVAPGATDLMLFARNKPDQGFIVIGRVP
ncbi:tetratricopeptide repeat protein [Roseiflexus castenholzii]|uniref:Tetratricopeptide TPR_2 repeat protein n=1 Tax=Roseiflexus castenholzii (strain DSM 13941 / HLO8) TaxID=383372 RepID=A7NF80_ROSCS|nr:hypothetical protein [Roseiflexus castenholzii]ABU56664.1 Tetratricopeptide TPR_2 repeat protein [Roseiflexus castenholzii DSM 13941]